MSSHGKYQANNLNAFTKKNRFKLQYGSNVYRILPPFGSLAESGKIAKLWEVYWFIGTDGRKRCAQTLLKTKGKGKDKTIVTRCPMYEKIEGLKQSLASFTASRGANDPIVKELAAKLGEYNLDAAYHLNVLTPTNQIGELKLSKTAFYALKDKLKELEDKNIDPINVGPNNGLFLDIKKTKTPENGKVAYNISVASNTHVENGKIISESHIAPIDESILKRMDTEAFDLGTLYKTPSYEDMEALATLDPKVVDRVFARAETVVVAETSKYSDNDEAAEAEEEVDNSTATSTVSTSEVTSAVSSSVQSTVSSQVANPPSGTVSSGVPAAGSNDDLIQRFLNGDLLKS